MGAGELRRGIGEELAWGRDAWRGWAVVGVLDAVDWPAPGGHGDRELRWVVGVLFHLCNIGARGRGWCGCHTLARALFFLRMDLYCKALGGVS